MDTCSLKFYGDSNKNIFPLEVDKILLGKLQERLANVDFQNDELLSDFKAGIIEVKKSMKTNDFVQYWIDLENYHNGFLQNLKKLDIVFTDTEKKQE